MKRIASDYCKKVEVVLFLNSFRSTLYVLESIAISPVYVFSNIDRAPGSSSARRTLGATCPRQGRLFRSPPALHAEHPPQSPLNLNFPFFIAAIPRPAIFFALIFRRLHSQKKLPPSCFFIDYLRCFETESCGEGQVIVKRVGTKIGPGVW